MRLSTTLLQVCAIATCALASDLDDVNVFQSLKDLGVKTDGLTDLATTNRNGAQCSNACNALYQTYGGDHLYIPGSVAYDNYTSSSYYSTTQRDVDPICVFKPADVNAVSAVVLLSRLTKCPWATRSGGHGIFPGVSNSLNGITVSMELLNEINLADDRKSVCLGTGSKWVTIYQKLETQNLTTMGARLATLGVGGFLLGGGVNFFASSEGWGCDNILEYTVVLANGKVVTASPESHPDLYFALRGGGTNFGLVTSFRIRTIEAGKIWGGLRTYKEENYPEMQQAFNKVANESPTDTNAGQWLVFQSIGGNKTVQNALWYTKPDGDKAPIFSDYFKIPATDDSTKNLRVSELATENVQGEGLRWSFWALTWKNSLEMNTAYVSLYNKLVDEISSRGLNILPFGVFQTISKTQIEKMSLRGGNPLGLKVEDAPLVSFEMNVLWFDPAEDQCVYDMVYRHVKAVKAETVARGVANEFLYMNYASQFQDPIAGYGSENKARLQAISKTYDPTGVFQRLNTGSFKLDGPPAPPPPTNVTCSAPSSGGNGTAPNGTVPSVNGTAPAPGNGTRLPPPVSSSGGKKACNSP